MPSIDPIQTNFNAGVISPRWRGRVGTKPYQAGLAKCENWIPTPQGSLLKRNGAEIVAGDFFGVDFNRLIPFKSTNLERFQIVLSDLLLQVFTPAGVFAAFTTELVVNSECNLGGGGWTLAGAARYGGTPGAYYLEMPTGSATQSLAAVPAGTYTFSFSATLAGTVRIGTSSGASDILAVQSIVPGPFTGFFTYTITLGAPTTLWVQFASTGSSTFWVDDVTFRASGGVSVATPWAPEDIANLQFVGETGRDRMVFVDGKHIPYVLSRLANGTWTFLNIATVGWTIPKAKPALTVDEWSGANWPSVVEIWQGRLWFGAAPAKKNTFWASKPGTYDFTIGDTAGDGFSYDVAMRGEIRWMQGQKVMLVGCDEGEYAISANDGVVYAGNINITQESAFGSAKVQAAAIGDEVIYVSPDRRKVRAIKFSLESGGWYSRDLTFAAEHITKPGIADLVFAREPYNTIILLLQDGTLACCNYDRLEEVNGWWTLPVEKFTAIALSVSNTSDGDEVWVLGDVLSSNPNFMVWGLRHILRIPLYETTTPELDVGFTAIPTLTGVQVFGAVTGTAAYDSTTKQLTLTADRFFEFSITDYRMRVGGTTFLVTNVVTTKVADVTVTEGVDVSIPATADWDWVDWFVFVQPSSLYGTRRAYPFAPGDVVTLVDEETGEISQQTLTNTDLAISPRAESAVYRVGYDFTAEAETLPLEGGNPAGTSQGFKVHYPDIAVRLNDSTPPLINDQRAGSGRPFSTPLDTVEARVTGDLKVKNVGVSEGGIITLKQDLPFRTEVCAIYATAQMSKV